MLCLPCQSAVGRADQGGRGLETVRSIPGSRGRSGECGGGDRRGGGGPLGGPPDRGG